MGAIRWSGWLGWAKEFLGLKINGRSSWHLEIQFSKKEANVHCIRTASQLFTNDWKQMR